jgi:hypothetical protein
MAGWCFRPENNELTLLEGIEPDGIAAWLYFEVILFFWMPSCCTL